MQAVIRQHSNQSHLPLVVSLTNVAVSKQKSTLQSTAATQVIHNSSGAAACRVRQHAMQSAPHNGHSDMQTRMDAAVEPTSSQVQSLYVCMCTCTVAGVVNARCQGFCVHYAFHWYMLLLLAFSPLPQFAVYFLLVACCCCRHSTLAAEGLP